MARYYCHHCKSMTTVSDTPSPVCEKCHSGSVEKVEEDNRPAQCKTQGQKGTTDCAAESVTDTEPVTDDGDEEYEDIEDGWSVEENQRGRQRERRRPQRRSVRHTNPLDEYDFDAYYDAVYDYNARLAYRQHLLNEHIAPHLHNYHHHHHDHNYDYDYEGEEEEENEDDEDLHDATHRNPMFEHLLDILYEGYNNLGTRTTSSQVWESFLQSLMDSGDGHARPNPAADADIDKLEKRKLEEGDAATKTECIICQEEFGVKVELIKLPCNHEYHGHCIRQWFRVSSTCPMCRKSVSREEESNESRSNELGVGTSFSMESDGQFVTLSSHSNGRFTSIGVSMSSLGYAANRNQGNEDDYDEDDDDDERSWAIPTARSFRICPHGHIIPNEPVRRFGNANNARNNREDPMNSLD